MGEAVRLPVLTQTFRCNITDRATQLQPNGLYMLVNNKLKYCYKDLSGLLFVLFYLFHLYVYTDLTSHLYKDPYQSKFIH